MMSYSYVSFINDRLKRGKFVYSFMATKSHHINSSFSMFVHHLEPHRASRRVLVKNIC